MSKNSVGSTGHKISVLVKDVVCRMGEGYLVPDAMQSEMLESGQAFGSELVDTVLASAPDVIPGEDAAAHAAIIAHTIEDTATRMRDGGLGDTLVAIWLKATVSAARHRLEERPALARSDRAR